MEYITDYITEKSLPNIGAEENRQTLERFLVEKKGFLKEDILVDREFEMEISGEPYLARMDLVIEIEGKMAAVVKTVAGSISSWEREVVSAARVVLSDYQIPFSIVSDGEDALILDTVSGKKINSGMDGVPSRKDLLSYLLENNLTAFPEEKSDRQKLVFRTYDMMNVNR